MRAHIALLAAFVLLGRDTAFSSSNPEPATSFDAVEGFKPAQRDLTAIYLQIAGSLEYYGSPVPYMQHMAKEHQRVEALYASKFGNAPRSYLPDYMTSQYLSRFATNWDILSPKLGLDSYTRGVGHLMRDAIKGTRGTGTILVDIFNQHQSKVFDQMAGKGTASADFDSLKAQLISQLELDKSTVDEEKYEMARRDAVSFALGIQGDTIKLFRAIDHGLSPSDAKEVKAAITGSFIDVGQMAESELEVGLAEWALRRQAAAAN